ncbi:phage tail protein [Solibacillus sp. FSL H8-0538]|uniref:phage tail protein n=1 Tax=Solibacillus sp. FSL H8-0538 TaxID=2921400 RepID=UPI0030F5E475
MAEAYIGEIRIFTGKYAPKGWALCDGQLLSITQNTALYTILGKKFGGDGETNFALPNLQGKTPLHQGTGTGLTPRGFAEDGGTATTTLIHTEIPAHTHYPNSKNSPNNDSPENTIWSDTNTTPKNGVLAYVESAPNTTMNPLALQAVGGSQPHNNMQPYLALNFIICINGGEYPVKG